MFAIKIQVFLKRLNMQLNCSPCRFLSYNAGGHLDYTNVYKYCYTGNEQDKTKLQLQNIAKITLQLFLQNLAEFLRRWFFSKIIIQKKLHAIWLPWYVHTHFRVPLTYVPPKSLLMPWLNNIICTIIICNNIIRGHLGKEAKLCRSMGRWQQQWLAY